MKNTDDDFVAQAFDGPDRLQDLKRLARSLRLLEVVWLLFVGIAVITPFFWGSFNRSAFLTLLGLCVAGVCLSQTYTRVLVLRAIHELQSVRTQPGEGGPKGQKGQKVGERGRFL